MIAKFLSMIFKILTLPQAMYGLFISIGTLIQGIGQTINFWGTVPVCNSDDNINLLSPSICIQILPTGLYTFPYRISWENLIKDQSIFLWWYFYSLITNSHTVRRKLMFVTLETQRINFWSLIIRTYYVVK